MKFLLIAMIIAVALATRGVDVAGAINNFSCFKQNGMSFAITRAFCSFGGVDTDGPQNLKNMHAAGLIADVYFFPCAGKSAQAQADAFDTYYKQNAPGALLQAAPEEDNFRGFKAGYEGHEYMETLVQQAQKEEQSIESTYQPQSNGDLYGTVWLDVEINPSRGCSWASLSATQSCQFLTDMVNALQAKGKRVGIYSSLYMWESIFGSRNGCAKFTNLDLWYAHYDNVASFSDWSSLSFGGWSRPAIKQYLGDTTLCNDDVDLNFY